MSDITVKMEQVEVEVNVCDGCGAVVRTLALIHGERFRPEGGGVGHQALSLWRGHPWDRKHLCYECLGRRVQVVPEYPMKLPGAIRVRIYDVEKCIECSGDGCSPLKVALANGCQGGWRYGDEGRGLRLRHRPMTEQEWSECNSGTILMSRNLAIPIGTRFGHHVPSLPEWVRELCSGDRHLVLCEVTKQTPVYPTVFDVTIDSELTDDELAEQWGAEIAERRDPSDPIYQLKLRVPVEIMQ